MIAVVGMPLAEAQEPEQPEQPDQVPRNPRVALGHAALRFGLDSADVLVLGERWGPGHRGEKGCEYQLLAHVRPPVCDEDAKRQRIGRDTVPLGERVWLSAKANARTDEGPGVLRDDAVSSAPLSETLIPLWRLCHQCRLGCGSFPQPLCRSRHSCFARWGALRWPTRRLRGGAPANSNSRKA